MPSIRCLAAFLPCLLAAAAAQAGTLTSANWFQVTLGVPMSRTTTQLGATGTSAASSISVNLAYPQFTTSVFMPKSSMNVLDLHLKLTQGGPQAITATPGMANGAPGVQGTVIIMTANHVAMGVNASMFNVGANTLLAVPVSIGHGGAFVGSFIVLGVTHTVTVDFFAWTAGMQTFTGLTSKGWALPPVVAAGSFHLNAAGAGTVTLVSPTKMDIDGSLAQRRTVGFVSLKLTFVPEPATALLLCAAACGLVLAARRAR